MRIGRWIFTLSFIWLVLSNEFSLSWAGDALQETFRINECSWALLAKSLDEKQFLRYSKQMVRQLESGEGAVESVAVTGPDNTTALRLETKNWATLRRIDAVVAQLKQEFPSLRMRDGTAVGVSSDLYRTIGSEVVLDTKTGRLVKNGIARIAENPTRYQARGVNFKLRVRKYEGTPLTEGRSKLEVKFQSLTDGVVYKPSVLFADSDLRVLLGAGAPSPAQVNEIRQRALILSLNGHPLNDAKEVDQILTAVELIRAAHAKRDLPFEPIVHIRYDRTAYLLPIEHGGDAHPENFDLQFTRDTHVIVMEPQIVPKILDPRATPSTQIWGRTSDGIGVLEVKRPLSKAGISPRLQRKTRYRQEKIRAEFPEIAEVDRILSPVVRSASHNDRFRINRGKRYAAGHGAFDENPLDDIGN